eukprot:scaffold10406_cov68-Phaeocystis_antarctica.AAC.4
MQEVALARHGFGHLGARVRGVVMELQPAAAGAVMAFRARCGNDERRRERRRERGRQCWRERGVGHLHNQCTYNVRSPSRRLRTILASPPAACTCPRHTRCTCTRCTESEKAGGELWTLDASLSVRSACRTVAGQLPPR